MEPAKGKTPALLGVVVGSGAPKGRPSPEAPQEQGAGAMAGEAFADAVKSGDGQAIYDAFETLYRECSRSSESDDEGMDTDADEGY